MCVLNTTVQDICFSSIKLVYFVIFVRPRNNSWAKINHYHKRRPGVMKYKPSTKTV